MTERVIAAALAPLQLNLPEAAYGTLAAYWELLREWRQAVNLTGCETAADFAQTLVAEALAPLSLGLAPPPDGEIVDVGSGGGSPGIPLSIAWPHRRFILIESRQKRAAFLRHVAATLPLPNVEVLADRAEDAGHSPDRRERYALAVTRAAAALPRACELCLPLVRPGGTVWLYLSGEDGRRLVSRSEALERLGGTAAEFHGAPSTGQAPSKCVGVVTKTGGTEAAYPRTEARARRDPLF